MKYRELTYDEIVYCVKNCNFTEEEKEYFLQKTMGTPEGFIIIGDADILGFSSKYRAKIKNGTKAKVEKALKEFHKLNNETSEWQVAKWTPLIKNFENAKVEISRIVDILGTDYRIKLFVKPEDDKNFQADEYMDGYTDYSTKTIVIRNQEAEDGCMEDLRAYREQVIRHEIVHAFLFESGLHASSDWATNEEIVDWIAIQLPKIIKVIQGLNPKTIEVSCVDEETKEEEDGK